MSATFDLSHAVRAYRMSLTLTIGQYAALVGVNTDTLRLLEDNKYYVYSLRLSTLDKLLDSLHVTREQFDPDFGRLEEAWNELAYAKQRGMMDKDIAEFLGISSLRTIRTFLDGTGNKAATYNTARTAFLLVTDEFRELAEGVEVKSKVEVEEEPADKQRLMSRARAQGFVQWELKDAQMVGNTLTWMSGNGTYRMVLTMTEFKAYYARTNTLSVYRDLSKKQPAPPVKSRQMPKIEDNFDAVGHARQADARCAASDMFKTIFGGG